MSNQAKHTPEESKFTITNPYPFVLGDISAHVDRVLRDKGAAGSETHKLVSASIMTCPEPGIHKEWMNRVTAILEENERLRKVIKAIASNPHVSLVDLIYQVRDREGNGWEGEAVRQWSDACVEIKKLLNP